MVVPEEIRPRKGGELDSDRVQNPHEPDATYGAKGQGAQKKEHMGYKVQIAESASEAVMAPGELVRGHGLRRARSRGLGKVKLQNYFIGAACNMKRWIV